MRRLLPLLVLPLLPCAASAGDDDAFVRLLAWQDLTREDLAAPWRDTVDRGGERNDPTRVASAEAWLGAPLMASFQASDDALRLRPAAGAGVTWDAFFAKAAYELRVEAVDPCEGDDGAAAGLTTASIAHEAEQGLRRSRREVKALEESLDARLNARVGQLLNSATDAGCTLSSALADLTPEQRAAAVSALERLIAGLPPGTTEAEEAAAALVAAWTAIDVGALLAAGQGWSDAVAEAAHELSALPPEAWPTTPQIWPTALGEVWIGSPGSNSGTGDPFLIVDPGGDDHWRVLPQQASLPAEGARSIRGWIDLGGDDLWQSGVAGVGSALFSIGAGLDLSGDDTWRSAGLTAGAAAFGVATWTDVGGDDRYDGGPGSQGFAAFGAAALVDRAGADAYTSVGPAQGAGLPAGLGLLHDVDGDDRFDAGAGGGQGASRGLFPLLGGGYGLLVDHGGDDVRHTAGPGQGGCEGRGAAAAVDVTGDDVWVSSASLTQAAGRRECAAVLVDIGGGADRYDAPAAAQGWGEDRAIGTLWEEGGADAYRVGGPGQGAADWGGLGLLTDLGGADAYLSGAGARPSTRTTVAVGVLADLDDDAAVATWQAPVWGSGGQYPGVIAVPADGAAAAALVVSHSAHPSEAASALEKAGPGVLAAVLATVSDRRPAEAEVVHRYVARGAGTTSAEQRRAMAQTIAADALGRDQSADDASVYRHLTWLAGLAARHVETTEDAVRVADALRDHPAWRVRSKALLVFRAVLTNPQLEVSEGDREGWEQLAAVALQNDVDPEVRWAAADLLERAGGPGVASILAGSMKVGDAVLRHRSEQALVAIAGRTDGLGVARSVFPLAEGDDGISDPVRAAALRVLGATGHREAWDVIEPALSDPEPAIRRAAVVGAASLLPNRKVEAALRDRLEAEPDARVAGVIELKIGG